MYPCNKLAIDNKWDVLHTWEINGTLMTDGILLLILILKMSQQRKAGREWERSINAKTSTTHTKPKQGRIRENSRRQKERGDYSIRKALALLLKPASSTPSNAGSLRSFQWDTGRGTKVLRCWEVLLWGGANECQWATKAPRVTRARQRQCTNQWLHWATFNFEYPTQHAIISHRLCGGLVFQRSRDRISWLHSWFV